MAIVSLQGAAIPSIGTANTAIKMDANNAITQVALSDCWRLKQGGGGRTIVKNTLTRVDVQSVDSQGRFNVQVQINDITGESTIAHVMLNASVGKTGGTAQAAQEVYAIRQIRGALQNSLSTGRSYSLTGTPT